MLSPFHKILLMLLLLISYQQGATAQCGTVISSFPYEEGFEGANNGNWIASPANAWQCGTPSAIKNVITSAGSGQKSWIVGGLDHSYYASGNSSLISPCFDFTSLSNPQVSFLVFWETERKYDGAVFQYSTNNGNTWTTLGTENSNSTCDGTNWYNTYPLINVGGTAGWSGNIQTGGGGSGNCLYGLGSGGWVMARHTMPMLAGFSNVQFRFYFGAGTQCNDFDGFAIDDIHIGNAAPPGVADFYFNCINSTTVQFVNNSAACNVQWDFDDVASGANNISTALNPVHDFSGTGEVHQVRLTAFFASGNTDVKTIPVNIVHADPQVLNLNKCNGESNNSFAVVNLGEASNQYTFNWNTSPVQTTATVSGLPGSDEYQVIVSAPGGCPLQVNFNYPDPPLLELAANATAAVCLSDNGSIAATVTGGVQPYSYNWNTTPVQHGAAISGLSPGLYNVSVSDGKGCTKQLNNIEVIRENKVLNISLGAVDFVCPGNTLTLSPGAFQSYLWQDNSTASTFTVKDEGTYSVIVSDENGCTGSASKYISGDCRDVYFPSAFTPGTDNINPMFGAIGNIASISTYQLSVYNRFGQLVFSSVDPAKKWDGTFKGQPLETQALVWVATYAIRGKNPVTRKGTILLVK